MSHLLARALVGLALLAALAPAVAQPDPNYVGPKGAYDTPATFVTKFENVGESYERTLGTPLSNGYQRQVRLKVLGLENLSRLTALKQSIDKGAEAEQKRQQASEDGKGGVLGGILGKLNPLMSKEVERQKEVAQDDLVVRLVEAGSPADTANAAFADVWTPPNQVTGSIFGVKVNNKVSVRVTSDDFRPRVLIMRHRPKGLMANHISDPAPEFSVVTNAELVDEGANKMRATFDRAKESADGSVGLFVLVTSEDGKAVTGKYKIMWEPQK